MALQLYHKLSQINKIRRKELILPIAKQEVVVSPLSVGDDFILKTALISPVKLDKELLRLLWNHTEFWIPNPQEIAKEEPETTIVDGKEVKMPPKKKTKKKVSESDRTGGSYKKLSEREFYNNISYVDKLVLMWGIFSTTYVTLGEQTLKCTECGETFKKDIIVDETLHEDSLNLYDQDIPFNKYTDTIIIPMNDDFVLEFTVGIPSMADFNRMLGLVSTQEIQYNLENIRSEFNTEQLITLYTKKLAVYPKSNPAERSESGVTQEILSSLRDFVNIEISTEFFRQYSEKFSKYNVNFYDESTCPSCGKPVKTEVDIEYFFFLRQLSH